ncbi:MAG TPA: HNH endonuclease signature motif containing protein, partial [Jatrophihabitantaceae bacterium]|nr:HNH endonuclease signature motif containing protein [Jatrophihabitantaceae bacterium]
ARRIASDETGTWRRLLTDPATGQLLEYGRSTYRPPQNLTDHVIARDRTCIFPHCRRPARLCDLDHREDWCTGGETCEHNLHPLCERHHYAKHNAGWTVERTDDGAYHWTAPTRHHYTVHPPDDS